MAVERIKSYSEKDTICAGEKFGKLLQKGDIIGLYGELGSGKTAFTKGIAKALGIEEYVTSPTFTVVNEYYGSLPLYHFDAYRIESADEMLNTGMEDYLDGSGIVVVEWADMIEELLPDSLVRVNLLKCSQDDSARLIEIHSRGEGVRI
jgi:tRNA threonylcarbamoyladenosine biosynthesis protein TsaE